MRLATVLSLLRKTLIAGAFCLLAAAAVAQDQPGIPGPVLGWDASPYRSFGPAQAILGGRVLLRDEAEDPALAATLTAELQRLSVELHEKQGWRLPAAAADPLRILIGRRLPDGIRRVASRGVDKAGLVSATIQLDATGMTSRQIVRDIERLYASATLAAYGLRADGFLASAAAEYLAGEADEQDREAALSSAAAPTIDLRQQPAALGRLYVEEFCRQAGGPAALRTVWEKAAETREGPLSVLQKSFAEATGKGENALLLSFAARLYVSLETQPAPSRVSQADLQEGALDTSAPGALSLRHRTFLAAPDQVGALRVTWPEDASRGAAVVRYRDAQLPPDVVYFAPGDIHAIPLAGVARVDWAVVGTAEGAAATPAPAVFEPLTGFPYSGLSAQAAAGPGGPRLTWTTASHDGLAGWAVFREEVLLDGRIAQTGPEMVPSSNRAEDSMRYVFVDPGAAAATFYRYTIWAVTQDGLLTRAFSATLRTPE